MANRSLFVRFTKIDEEKREVAGRLTQEIVDRDNEIWDYDASVPHMKAWSDSFSEATDGKSLGNLRAMHQPISAGKLTAINFNDVEKSVDIVTKIVDDTEWGKVQEGLYTGFSLGGRVVKSWRDPKDAKFKRFEVRPIEASLADMPCVPTATFSYIKTGGLAETRHFNKIRPEPVMKPTKFADTAARRFPIETKAQARVSLAAWGKTALRTTLPAETQQAITAALLAAATEHGIENVTEKALFAGDFNKGLYDVSRLANLIQDLAWLQQCSASERDYEGDDSTVPDEITATVATLLSTLATMVGEEGDELLRVLGLDVAAASSAAATAETGKAATPAVSDASTAAAIDASAAAAPATPTAETPTTEKVDTVETTEKVADTSGSVGSFEKGMTKKHLAALQDMHDHAKVLHKMMSDHCEKLAGMIESATATDDDSAKVAEAEFTKVSGERADFEKRAIAAEASLVTMTAERDTIAAQANELAVAGQKLMEAVEVRKGHLVAVDREGDGVTALRPESTEKADDPAPPAAAAEAGSFNRDAFVKAMRKTFSKPQRGAMPAKR